LLIGLLFLFAALLKAQSAPTFREVVGTIMKFAWPGDGALPEQLRYPGISIITAFTITIEASIAAMLFFSPLTRIGLKLAATTLVFFSLALGLILLMPNPPSCGCLGGAGTSSMDATTDAMVGIVRNVALVVLILWILKSTRQPSLDSERALESA